MARFDLVIFDLDGTLVDSLEDISDALSLTLERFDLPPVSIETLRRHIGTGVKPLLRSLFQDVRKERVVQALETFDEIYASCSTVKTRPYPGIEGVLDDLGDATKVVLTNKSSKFVDSILDGLNLSSHFVAAFGREAFSEHKPSRVPIDAILARFGASPDRCVIVGDTPVDILAGKAAGIATCGVLYGYGIAEDLERAAPDAVVSRPADLLHVI